MEPHRKPTRLVVEYDDYSINEWAIESYEITIDRHLLVMTCKVEIPNGLARVNPERQEFYIRANDEWVAFPYGNDSAMTRLVSEDIVYGPYTEDIFSP